jgi:glutamyl-Q tRNA(Asp) synthetase
MAPASDPTASAPYRGRFAPSPSGPLHHGSLFTALASYLDARRAGGDWLLRIEDIDPPREADGAAEAIQTCLEAHGLHPDAPALFQSTRSAAYEQALARLDEQGLLFRCRCTRRELGARGECRGRCDATATDDACALRVRVSGRFEPDFDDLIQGPQSLHDNAVARDFVVRRKDGLYAYQLAVVVDEAHQGISHIIRGVDLLPTTFQQRYLQTVLGLPQPLYGHVPVLIDAEGRKLSKQNHAAPVDSPDVARTLRDLLALLGQTVAARADDDPDSLLQRAAASWQRDALRGLKAIPWAQKR